MELYELAHLELGLAPPRNFDHHVEDAFLFVMVKGNVVERRDGDFVRYGGGGGDSWRSWTFPLVVMVIVVIIVRMLLKVDAIFVCVGAVDSSEGIFHLVVIIYVLSSLETSFVRERIAEHPE